MWWAEVSQIVVAGSHYSSSQDGRLVQMHWRWHDHDYLSYPCLSVPTLVPGEVLAIVLLLVALVLLQLALVPVSFLALALDLRAMMLVMTMKSQARDVIELLLDTVVVVVADVDVGVDDLVVQHQQHHQYYQHHHSVVISEVVSCTAVVVVIAVLDDVFVFFLHQLMGQWR